MHRTRFTSVFVASVRCDKPGNRPTNLPPGFALHVVSAFFRRKCVQLLCLSESRNLQLNSR